MGLLILAIIGLVIGAVAKVLMPGPDPGGWFATTDTAENSYLPWGQIEEVCRIVGIPFDDTGDEFSGGMTA